MAAIERLAERELGAMETLFLMGDSEVVTRSSIAVLIRLSSPPDYEAVVRVHERASRLVPHLRSKVVAPVLPVSRPYWVVDPDFDVRYHVRHTRLPGDGSEADLLQFVEVWGAVPVDPARPLWEVTVVDGLADGTGAVLFKLHHALSDGQGIQEIWSNVFDLAPGMPPGELPLVPAADDVTGMDLTRQKLNQLPFELGHQGVGGARSAVVLVKKAIGSPRHTVSSVGSYATSLRRSLASTPAPPSPLLRRRGAKRAFVSLSVPLADLRRSAKAMGASVNDAYVAAVLGGLARYHDVHESPARELLIALPVSVRRDVDKAEQNRFVGVRIAGPLCGFGPAERARLVKERVRSARDEPALEAFLKVAPAVSRLPLWLTSAAVGTVSAPADAQLSNVPAWPDTAYLCGVEVTGFFGFGPLAGAAMMVVMTSQGGRCDVAINLDRESVPDPDTLLRCVQESFDEVLASGRQPAA